MAEKKMIIDGVSCPFTTERNVLEVARNNGIDIPSLCYCENLSIYGGCRLVPRRERPRQDGRGLLHAAARRHGRQHPHEAGARQPPARRCSCS